MRRQTLIVTLGFLFSLCLSFPSAADTLQLREDAPERHVVVKGDTLWDISARFLKSPWRWPELWQSNKEDVRNPHLIYPDDVIYLVQTPDGPRLLKLDTVRLAVESAVESTKLSPRIRSEVIRVEEAIPTLPYTLIQPFLQRPLIASASGLNNAARVIATEDGRGLITLGDRIYASATELNQPDWHIVRLGRTLREPESGVVLAHEVDFVGHARLKQQGRPATLEIAASEREVLIGDILIPAVETEKVDFTPRSPTLPIAGQIISAYGSNQSAGKYSTVIINKGRRDGLEPGHVLAVYRAGKTVGGDERRSWRHAASFGPSSGYLDSARERGGNNAYAIFQGDSRDTAKANWAQVLIGCLKPGKQATYGEPVNLMDVHDPRCRPSPVESVRLPDVRTGLIMVYRVFDQVSYALVMESDSAFFLLDRVANP